MSVFIWLLCVVFSFLLQTYSVVSNETTLLHSSDSPSSLTCGKVINLRLNHDGRLRESLLYIPCVNASKWTSKAGARLSSKPVMMPLMLSLHCFGCANERLLKQWTMITGEERKKRRFRSTSHRSRKMVILSPRGGIGKPCWNARQCCGKCVTEKHDDVGFISLLVDLLIQVSNHEDKADSPIFPSLSRVFRAQSIALHRRGVFVSGNSNGGFMSDYLAWLSVIRQLPFHIVTAVPRVGYIYDSEALLPHPKNIHGSEEDPDLTMDLDLDTAVILHNGLKDDVVNPQGCCIANRTGCCCDIWSYSDKCVSVSDESDKWRAILNGGTRGIRTDMIELDEGRSQCWFESSAGIGRTVLCLHPNEGHKFQGRMDPFPLIPQTVAVMFREICTQFGGRFRIADNAAIFQLSDSELRSNAQCVCDLNKIAVIGSWCDHIIADSTHSSSLIHHSVSAKVSSHSATLENSGSVSTQQVILDYGTLKSLMILTGLMAVLMVVRNCEKITDTVLSRDKHC